MKNLLRVLLTSVLLIASFSYATADPRLDLVSYWPMDAENGGMIPDAWFTNHLSIIGPANIAAGTNSNAFVFDGTTTNYLLATHGSADNALSGFPIFASPGGFTVCLWVKAPPVGPGGNAQDRYLFTEGSTNSNNPVFALQTRNGSTAVNSNKLDVFVRPGTTALVNHLKSTAVVFDNTWHHVAWVDDHANGSAKLYVDGNLDATSFNYTTASGGSFYTTAIGALVRTNAAGQVAGSGFFMGSLDSVGIWQRCLSQDEVLEVMTNGLAVADIAATILQQPVGSTNAMGDYIKISVGAYGNRPLSYQWYKNGVALDGKTAALLAITDAIAASSNAYWAVVTNAFGAATSSIAPVVVQPDSPPNVTAGLVSYWPLDVVEDSPASTNTPDIYYRHNDLQLFGIDTNLWPGAVSNCLNFDGATAYGKKIGGSPIYAATNYSIAFWVNGAPGQANRIVYAEGTGTNNNIYFLLGTENSAPYGGSLNVKANPGLADHKSTRPVFDNAWHQVVWTDENGKALLYVDGVLDETDYRYNRANVPVETTAVGALFRASASLWFAGFIDEVAVWNRRLNYTEVQQLYAGSIPPPSIVAPVITQQPAGSTNRLGERMTLSVVATGTDPVYQWLRDGAPVSGATNRSLVLYLTNAATNNYTVLITNIAGSITSDPATVMVLPDAVADVRSGLLHYWPLNTINEIPSPTTPDLYSNDPLALTSTMTSANLSPSLFGSALNFYGGEHAERAGGFPVYAMTNYTVSFWVNGYGAGQSNRRVFGEGSTNSNNPVFALATDSAGASARLSVYLRTDGGTGLINDRKSTRDVFDGTWHHVVWVDENGQAKLFIDGVLDETDYRYNRGVLTLNTTTIGALLRTTLDYYFTGQIDEVALWGRALSWTEIQSVNAGVPNSPGPLPPVIVTQPADQINDVWATDYVSFSVMASGSSPLQYQWRKNGVPMLAAGNPTATNGVLVFTQVQTSDAGSYDVVITNVAGTITSTVAQLTVIPYVPVTSGEVVKLDFGKTNSPAVQAGFTEMLLPLSGTNFNGLKVTISAIGGIALGDRNRAEGGALVIDNPPALTQAALYNDFIFGNNKSTANAGVRILIERLAANTLHGLTVWSFDPQSAGNRYSDWAETSSGTPVTITNGYYFSGGNPPVHDFDHTFGALLRASPAGTLQLEGIRTGADFSVFVNGLRLVANPVVRITSAQVVNGMLRLSAEAQYPGQMLSLEAKSDIAGSVWSPVPTTDIAVVGVHGPIIIADVPLSTGPAFYRAVYSGP